MLLSWNFCAKCFLAFFLFTWNEVVQEERDRSIRSEWDPKCPQVPVQGKGDHVACGSVNMLWKSQPPVQRSQDEFKDSSKSGGKMPTPHGPLNLHESNSSFAQNANVLKKPRHGGTMDPHGTMINCFFFLREVSLWKLTRHLQARRWLR